MKTVFMRSSTSLLRNSDDIFSVGFFHQTTDAFCLADHSLRSSPDSAGAYKHSQRGHIDCIPFGDNENIGRFSGSFTRCIGRHQRSRHNHPDECATRNDVWLSRGGTGRPASRNTPSRAPSYYARGPPGTLRECTPPAADG